MKWQSLLLSAGFLLVAPSVAQAQDVQDDVLPKAPAAPVSPGLRVQQQQLPARNYTPGVRYTTGSVTVSGWEKGLTDGDPNLRHWNWSAVTSYTQSVYGKVPAGAYLDKSKQRQPGSIYVKPVHINPDTYAKKFTEVNVPVEHQGPKYVANSTARTGTGATLLAPRYVPVNNETPRQTATNVSAKVRFHKAPPAVKEPEPKPIAKTYGSNYTEANVGAQICTPKSNRSVYGRLMGKK